MGRGRPPNPLDPTASHAARLGAEVRTHRLERKLTQQALGDLTGYSPQHISGVERTEIPASKPFVEACEAALDAGGALLELLPAAAHERETARQERVAARRAARDLLPLGCEAHSEAGGEDLNPTNRRGIIGAGAGAALGLSVAATPTQARQIDPELPSHSAELLKLLGRHDAAFGPHEVLAAVRHHVRLIAEHREIATGDLRTALMREEARWAEFAAWLSNDAGQTRARTVWTDRALRLATQADYPDIAALAQERQSQWAAQEHDARRAIPLAEAALRVPGTSAETRAICALRAAHAYALAGDTAACERHLSTAFELPATWMRDGATAPVLARAAEARCWLYLNPRKAIALYESVLRDWPRDCVRTGGLQQARIALACVAVGERDRAEAEGRKARAIARSTKSDVAARELKRLGAELRAA